MDMKKMLDKKSSKDVSPEKKEAKLSALKGLRQMASEMMGEDLKNGNLKKVTVAAKDTESLKEGLDKAKEIVPEMEKALPASLEESEEEEIAEESEPMSIEECETPEQIDEMIAKLQEKKRELAIK